MQRTGLSNAGYKAHYAIWHTKPISNEEILVSPVVSLDDIEQQLQEPPATEHVINGYGCVELYRGNDPATWLREHNARKRADSDMLRCSKVDGWYEMPPVLSAETRRLLHIPSLWVGHCSCKCASCAAQNHCQGELCLCEEQ